MANAHGRVRVKQCLANAECAYHEMMASYLRCVSYIHKLDNVEMSDTELADVNALKSTLDAEAERMLEKGLHR